MSPAVSGLIQDSISSAHMSMPPAHASGKVRASSCAMELKTQPHRTEKRRFCKQKTRQRHMECTGLRTSARCPSGRQSDAGRLPRGSGRPCCPDIVHQRHNTLQHILLSHFSKRNPHVGRSFETHGSATRFFLFPGLLSSARYGSVTWFTKSVCPACPKAFLIFCAVCFDVLRIFPFFL